MRPRIPIHELCGRPGGPIAGDAVVPGDKSISHRALILGAMAEGETRIHRLLESADVQRTAAAVAAFGAAVERIGPGQWSVRGGPWRSPAATIDCGNAGTAARLLMGAAAGQALTARFDGDESLRGRPMGRVIEPLRLMGARFEGGPLLPLAVTGSTLKGIGYRSPHASAQVKSAILLAGLGADGPVEVVEPAPSRDHSERMLRAFGVPIEVQDAPDGHHVRLSGPRRLRATEISVPGDPSSAAFPLVAALLVPGSEIILRGVLANPLRTGLFEVLQTMGAELSFSSPREFGGEPIVDLHVRASRLVGTEVAAAMTPRMIDEYPVLAVAAACAEGKTVMHGLGELRVKESDRLAAIVAGLRECGVRAAAEGDSLTVHGCDGPPPGGARVSTHGDHRIAMAFLVLGLAAREPVIIDRADMIETSFPGFVDVMQSLGARIGSA